MNFIDLFAGIGGFRLGMEQAGHKCLAYCEKDKFALQTYKSNFNTDDNIGWNDIKDVTEGEIIEFGKQHEVDIICAGFPCQAFSIAGKKRGFADTRGTMFFELEKFAKILKPKYLLFENVKGLLTHDRGRTFATILYELWKLGYDAEWQVLNSKDFNVPQNRERVFIIGRLRGKSTRQIFPIVSPTGKNICKLKEITSGLSQAMRIYDPSGLAVTLRSLGGGLGAKMGLYAFKENNTIRVRKLTPLECFRVQGFPDSFYKNINGLSDSQLYKQAGNAVTVPVIYEIAKRL